jgi:hypothetical protein
LKTDQASYCPPSLCVLRWHLLNQSFTSASNQPTDL